MKLEPIQNEEHSKLLLDVAQRQSNERTALASLTPETLKSLNLSIEGLPQKCQQLLKETSQRQAAMEIEQLDPIAISVQHSKKIAEMVNREYDLLEIKHQNVVLQKEIDANKIFIENLRKELETSKKSLEKEDPNPDNIVENVRQVKQKMASYKEIYEKNKAKFTKMQVPEGVLPKQLEELINHLATLKQKEEMLRQRANDITLARQARETLSMLRR